MRLLYATESVPNRDAVLGDGSSMIPYELIRHFPEDVSVTLLTYGGPVPVPDDLRRRCESVTILPTRPRRSALLRSAFGLNGLGKHERSTPQAIEAVSELSGSHDATLIHGPHALFLSHYVQGPVVLQTVDPWSIRAGMDTAIAGGLRRPAYRARELQSLRAERRLPQRALLLTVGAQDAVAWSRRLGRPVRSIPNGAEPAVRTGAARTAPVACFVGSLNYGPNIDSATVLVTKVAPRVWQRIPDARFVLAGRRPARAVLSLAGPGVNVLANVPSVVDIFAGADVAVFPDERGVGIRNSVREALAAGVPVVATPVAAREQDAHPLLCVEADPEIFVDRVVEILSRPPRVSTASEVPVRTWETVATEYLEELRTAIGSATAHQPPGNLKA